MTAPESHQLEGEGATAIPCSRRPRQWGSDCFKMKHTHAHDSPYTLGETAKRAWNRRTARLV